MVSAQSIMAPPNNNQRIETVEEKLMGLEKSIAERVDRAVEKAIAAAISSLRETMTEQLQEGQSEVTKKMGEDMVALGVRLEGRISRDRENQEVLINQMKADQSKFQDEIKSAISTLQISQGSPEEHRFEMSNGRYGGRDEGARGTEGNYGGNAGDGMYRVMAQVGEIGNIESSTCRCSMEPTQMSGFFGQRDISPFTDYRRRKDWRRRWWRWTATHFVGGSGRKNGDPSDCGRI